MPKIHKSTVDKYNAQMKNGFVFDGYRFACNGIKSATAGFKFTATGYVEANIFYSKRWDRDAMTYNYEMKLRVSYYEFKESGAAWSNGMGKIIDLGNYEKQMFSEIIKKTAEIDEAFVMNFYGDNGTVEPCESIINGKAV